MSDYNSWRERADRGTSGDMVHGILSDWNKERQLLSEAVTRLLKFNEELCQDVNVINELSERGVCPRSPRQTGMSLWRCPICGHIMTEEQSKGYRGCPSGLHLAQHEEVFDVTGEILREPSLKARVAEVARQACGMPPAPVMVPCSLCSNPTPMTGTKLCDRCWELKHRIEADPEIARRILKTL